jgi:molybdate transport system ATP-binding protein
LPISDEQWLVSLDRVDVEIAGATVLEGLDWRLRAGSHWGIVGSNGSGKSSLLALIAGTLWPAPGRGERHYRFDGRTHRDAIHARRHIAFVGPELQDRYTRWELNFSALDVVLSGVFRTDVPRRRPDPAELSRARALLAAVGLAELAGRRFLELSRGEQRRVLIARAMAFEPRILLLDEPASGLDRNAKIELDRILARIADRATTVTTAHSVDDLPSITTDVLTLDRGRIVGTDRYRSAAAEVAASRVSPMASGHARAVTSAAPGVPLIEVEHADAWRGGRRVLVDLCWRLDHGRHWLVLGDNGAGKSSFLKLLHGQLRPARGGRVAWPALGDPRSVWALRKLVAYVSPELQAEYRYAATVRECIASGFESSFGLTRAATPAERARTEQLLERFEFEAFADRRLTSLSYGQLRRVLLARTLVNRPRVLLLDEPWSGLDPATIALLRKQLLVAVAEGAQLVCASHRPDTALPFTDEMTLAAGRIVEAHPAVIVGGGWWPKPQPSG